MSITVSAGSLPGLEAPLQHGAAEDIDGLVERLTRPALALARRIVVDKGLAEDVVQEVFVALWRSRSSFDSARGNFDSWVLAAVHHKAVDAVRREEAHRRRQPDRDVPSAADSGDPAEPACRRAEQAQVRAALAALPIAQRQAIALAYYGGHSQREIAVLTDTPVGTVKTRMRTGMRTLRGRLTADHGPAQRMATPSA